MPGRFVLDYRLENVRPASYNPRKIDPGTLDKLKRSLKELGLVKPLIVTEAGLIVAGHQRVKSLVAIGQYTAPTFILESINERDEVLFNQMHNGTDLELDCTLRVPPSGKLGFEMIPARLVTCEQDDLPGEKLRREIARLLVTYGNWGTAVATQSGEILNQAHYVLTCLRLNLPVRVCRIPDAQRDAAKAYLWQQYGKFDYSHIERNTWNQTYAQKYRLRSDEGGGSTLYRTFVIPDLKPGVRLLDFGCGQADYVKALSKQGVNILGVEFYYRRGQFEIDTRAVHVMCGQVFGSLRSKGRFDSVICDSVLNSVDTPQAEHDVLTTLNAFCREGGTVFFSSRSQERVQQLLRTKNAARKKQQERAVEFLDDNGFSALLKKGRWFFQKFHTRDQMHELAEQYFGPKIEYRSRSSSHLIKVTKSKELDPDQIQASIEREFNLPWPNGLSVGKAAAAVEAYRQALQLE